MQQSVNLNLILDRELQTTNAIREKKAEKDKIDAALEAGAQR